MKAFADILKKTAINTNYRRFKIHWTTSAVILVMGSLNQVIYHMQHKRKYSSLGEQNWHITNIWQQPEL